jgi:uncharacterized protein (DUF362 family)
VHEIENVHGNKVKMRVSRVAEEFDYVISVAPPKSHNAATMTAGVKNMMGLVKKEDMSLMHGLRSGEDVKNGPKTLFDYLPGWLLPWLRRRVPQRLIDFFFMHYGNFGGSVKVINKNLAKVLQHYLPDLAVIDGFYGMDGNGPIDGFGVKLGVAVSSTDALKADGVACRLMGLESSDVAYLYYLHEKGLGDYSLEGLVGEKLEKHAKKFRLHGTYAVQKMWRD